MTRKTGLSLGLAAGLALVFFAWFSGERAEVPTPPGQPAGIAQAGLVPEISPPPVASPSVPASATVANVTPPMGGIFGARGPVTMDDIPEGRFRRQLHALAPAVRVGALQRLGELQIPVNDVDNLHVDRDGMFFYVDPPPTRTTGHDAGPQPTGETTGDGATPDAVASAAAVPVSAPPVRHSRPGATNILYLDFNGHVLTGTAWNASQGVTAFVAEPYDTDGDYTTFSDTEQAAILDIWARVAEDFAPFDVDVTTEEPAAFTRTTGRALITRNIDANGVNMPSSGAGGVAYIGVFGQSNYAYCSPALIYYNNLGSNAAFIAEATAHELGHNVGLSHDGTTGQSYYAGHGSGETSWGPIMGTGYNRNVSQWSKGDYYQANNPQDDFAIMAGKLGYRPDDAGNSIGTAAAATVVGGAISAVGMIEKETDVDVFTFYTAAGSVSLAVSPFRAPSDTAGGDADLKLELLNSAGELIAADNPAATTSAAMAATVPAGRYYVRISPVGTGSPLTSSPTGYTRYGSCGQYTLTGVMPTGSPVITNHPASQSVTEGSGVTFTVVALGEPTLTYQWQKAGVNIPGVTSSSLTLTNVQLADASSFTVVVSNVAGSVTSDAALLTVKPTFVSWQQSKFTAEELANPAVSGSEAVCGADGIPNLVKYALGLEPKQNVVAGLPVLTADATDWVFTYTRPSDTADVVYSVQWSVNLAAWSTSGVTHRLVATNAGCETWEARYPKASGGNIVMRLAVTR